MSENQDPREIVKQLRRLALSVPPQELGVPDHAGVWAVIMELSVDAETATLVAMADGTASLYVSSGFGVIGGHDHSRVREAAERLVTSVPKAFGVEVSDEYPKPAPGTVRFYFREDGSTKTVEIEEEAIRLEDHPLHQTFVRGHELLAEIRAVVEMQTSESP
ncbi:MAG: hypothetical protein D6724_04695 [Armatimonadetes bacterium]|nr:MAG: hypothetical protein D6724_04695 [Armatimonadota bacterium]